MLIARIAVILALAGLAAAQNSNRKLRTRPSVIAAQAGKHLDWYQDLDKALAAAAHEKKPVFWYIPTLSRSPMDRKPEIDRYMMAGPFSWPELGAALSRDAILLRKAVGRTEMKRFGLKIREFIEPGFLVLDPKGKELMRVDQITTFHPAWFRQVLATIWSKAPEAELLESALMGDAPKGDTPLVAFARGAIEYRKGHSEAARKIWKASAEAHPADPMSAKMMMEVEDHGPFVRGFEVYGALPKMSLTGEKGGASIEGTRAPADTFSEAELWRRSRAYMLQMQRDDGGFVDSLYDFGGTDSLPNVYTAVTAIAGLAYIEMLERDSKDEAVRSALDAAIAYVLDDKHLNSEDKDELIWAHLYRVRLVCRMIEFDAQRKEALIPELKRITGKMFAMQPEHGAWYHEYPNPFVSASVLIALKHAERHGAKVPDDVLARGFAALLRSRAKDGGYSYGSSKRPAREGKIPASAGRMPLAELARSIWGEGRREQLEAALKAAFKYHDEMGVVRKYDDHASRLGYGGFFFWYDMHGRSEAIEHLPGSRLRKKLLKQQRALVLSLPEIDGCFVDSHELGRVYGTAMALLCLSRK